MQIEKKVDAQEDQVVSSTAGDTSNLFEDEIPLDSGQKEEVANNNLQLGWLDIWSLGITIVLGGQYFSWNFGLAAGFGSFFIATVLIGISYTLLSICNAELASSLPFAGGAYGLARISLGLYYGFVIGMAEAMEYVVYVATSAYTLSLMIIDVTDSHPDMVLVYCLLFYVSAIGIICVGGKFFWYTNHILCAVSAVILVIFCFGSFKYVDLAKWAPTEAVTGVAGGGWFIGGMSEFMTILPLSTWFFVGVESLNLCSNIVKDVSI